MGPGDSNQKLVSWQLKVKVNLVLHLDIGFTSSYTKDKNLVRRTEDAHFNFF
jgi:hypothetical protein